jgi:hypothetical protein
MNQTLPCCCLDQLLLQLQRLDLIRMRSTERECEKCMVFKHLPGKIAH